MGADRNPRPAVSPLGLVALATFALVAVAAHAGAPPATIQVTTTADDILLNGNCTLREALIAANLDAATDGCEAGQGADTILVPPGEFVLTLTGLEDAGLAGDLDVTSVVAIVGAGVGSTVVDANGGADRAFHVFDAGELSLRRLTVRGGSTNAAGAQILLATGRTLVAEEVRLTSAVPPGPAVFLTAGATASISRCRVDGNLAGGFLVQPGAALTIDACLVDSNEATQGGAVVNSGELLVRRSTLSGNRSSFDGGAIANSGAATLVNSTLVGNQAQRSGGAIVNSEQGVVTVYSSTIARNTSIASGGGILSQGALGEPPPTTELHNTVLAENETDLVIGDDCAGSTITSRGHALIGSTAGCDFVSAGAGDLTDVSPMLGSLGDHGGATPTIRLQAGSPAIDAGDPAGCAGLEGAVLATDQRGFVRVDRCDIGAHEAGSPGPDRVFRDGFESASLLRTSGR